MLEELLKDARNIKLRFREGKIALAIYQLPSKNNGCHPTFQNSEEAPD